MKTMFRSSLLGLLWLSPLSGFAQPTVTDTAAAAPMAPGASSRVPATETATPVPSGLYFPAGSNVANANSQSLPSSSRPVSDTGASSDGFDLNSNRGAGTVRGTKGSFAITGQSVQAVVVPDVHTVRRGDTLWDLCGHYEGNPWDWPRIWSYNPEIRNPNWIYPGDQIRMRSADEMGLSPVTQVSTLGGGRGGSGTGKGSGFDRGTGGVGYVVTRSQRHGVSAQ